MPPLKRVVKDPITGKRVFKKVKLYKDKRRPKRRAFKAAVKRVITSMAEKKIQTYTSTVFNPLVLRTGSASIAANLFPMSPALGYYVISQGSSVADREGNEIRVHKAVLSYNITPNPYNATTNPAPTPCFVRIWFVRYKPATATLPPSASIYGANATFLDNGATDTGFNGTFQDLQLPVNGDSFTVLGYKTHKIAPSVYEGTGATPTAGNFANNDFKLCVLSTIDITKYFPKVIRWDDTTADPTSPMVAMLVQPIFSTGIQPGALIAPISMKFSLRLIFTDD